jgi:hypothetical protein
MISIVLKYFVNSYWGSIYRDSTVFILTVSIIYDCKLYNKIEVFHSIIVWLLPIVKLEYFSSISTKVILLQVSISI